jgi:hypothetical protein
MARCTQMTTVARCTRTTAAMCQSGDDAAPSGGVGSSGVLAAGEGDGALRRDEVSSAMCADVGNDTSSDGSGLSPAAIWLWAVPSAQATIARVASARASWPAATTPLAKATSSLGGAGSMHASSIMASRKRGQARRRPRWGVARNNVGGLGALASGGATLLVVQRGRRLGVDAGGLQDSSNGYLVAIRPPPI